MPWSDVLPELYGSGEIGADFYFLAVFIVVMCWTLLQANGRASGGAVRAGDDRCRPVPRIYSKSKGGELWRQGQCIQKKIDRNIGRSRWTDSHLQLSFQNLLCTLLCTGRNGCARFSQQLSADIHRESRSAWLCCWTASSPRGAKRQTKFWCPTTRARKFSISKDPPATTSQAELSTAHLLL